MSIAGDLRRVRKAGFVEKEADMGAGATIHCAEGPNNGRALLLIHGQTGAWDDYAPVLPALSERWHVFAVDCYGHGRSSRDAEKYSLRANGDDLIRFVERVIGAETVVSGHSSGALLAAYVAAYGGKLVRGAVLEDPPVFSTEPENFPTSFAYLDTYRPMHEYLASNQAECWEAYYLRHCLWGRLYMPGAMNGLANYAQRYRRKHPGEPVRFFFLPASLGAMFLHMHEYDLRFGERFYDYTWHSGIPHERLMADVRVPAVFLHAKDSFTEDVVLLAASSDEQARRAAALMGACEFVEIKSGHDIHRAHPQVFLEAMNRLLSA